MVIDSDQEFNLNVLFLHNFDKIFKIIHTITEPLNMAIDSDLNFNVLFLHILDKIFKIIQIF